MGAAKNEGGVSSSPRNVKNAFLLPSSLIYLFMYKGVIYGAYLVDEFQSIRSTSGLFRRNVLMLHAVFTKQHTFGGIGWSTGDRGGGGESLPTPFPLHPFPSHPLSPTKSAGRRKTTTSQAVPSLVLQFEAATFPSSTTNKVLKDNLIHLRVDFAREYSVVVTIPSVLKMVRF